MINDEERNFTYDAIGRTTEIEDIQNSDMSCRMSYDMFNNMIRSYLYNRFIPVSYAYDANGLRVYKYCRFFPSESQYYLNDDAKVLAEYDLSGNLSAEYIYGLRGMIAKVEPDEGYYFYYKDHLGSTRHLSQNAQTNDYFPYGESMEESGTETQYRFSGKELDNFTGFYYYGARYYMPEIGRWMVPDPLAEKYPTLSPYVYCANNPLRYIDPKGMFWEELKNWFSGNGWTKSEQEEDNNPKSTSNESTTNSDVGLSLASFSPLLSPSLPRYIIPALPTVSPIVLNTVAVAGAIASTVTLTDTPKPNPNVARVFAWSLPGQDTPHFSISVNGIHTEQIVKPDMSTTMAYYTHVPGSKMIGSIVVPLVDATSSNAYQSASIGTNRGKYNVRTNSCLTTCADVISAGGTSITRSEIIKLMRGE